VLQQLDQQLGRLANHDPDLPANWQQRSALNGRTLEVATEKRSYRGTCEGIDENGALMLKTQDGLERLFTGQVQSIE